VGLVREDADDEQVRDAIVKLCEEQRCSPILFNQGASYAGYHAFDLSVESLLSCTE